MNSHTNTQAAPTVDRVALLALLNVGKVARTSKGCAGKGYDFKAARPFYVAPNVGITTWHESAALAIARLANL